MTQKTDKTNSKKGKWTRRAFMLTGGLLGTGLVVGVAGMTHVNRKIQQFSGKGLGDGASLNAWIRIAADNTITLAIPRAEMGQGVYTSLPMLIAEELEVDLDAINVVHPQPESPYTNLFMVTQSEPNVYDGYSVMQKMFAYMTIVGTGGSTSVSDGFTNLRYAGATARDMLRQAAANRWSVDLSQCEAKGGHVVNKNTEDQLTYGELAEEASAIELVDLPALKPRSEWRLLGKPTRRLDIPDKVQGAATFSIDVRMDNMHYGVIRHPSVIGGSITSITNKEEIEAMPGVKGIVMTEYGAVAVADNTWRAKNAALAMRLEEDDAGNTVVSTEQILGQMDALLAAGEGTVMDEEGDVDAAFQQNQGTLVEARYDLPYLAHAAMEPLNCAVRVTDDKADVWIGHQASSIVANIVNEMTGVSKDNIMVHTTYLGGGFGRKAEPDFVRIATAVAMEMKGTPVLTTFTREADMQHDYYRPAAASAFKAVVQPDGTIAAWQNSISSQPVGYQAMHRIEPSMASAPEKDGSSTEGATHLPYIMQSRKVTFDYIDSPIGVGFWRSVGSSTNAFFTECFMDECAEAAQMDPYAFRRAKLDAHPRFRAVLDKVAEMSDWSSPAPEGVYRGISLHKSFGSIVGQVAEISQAGDKTFSIDTYYNVIDCGTYINPDIIESQMAGGIIYALTAALYGEITWKDGAAQEMNFPQYEMVRMAVAPEVKVHIMELDEYPGGVGEPAVPPAAPALANALYAATGERIRSLPLVKQGYRFV